MAQLVRFSGVRGLYIITRNFLGRQEALADIDGYPIDFELEVARLPNHIDTDLYLNHMLKQAGKMECQ